MEMINLLRYELFTCEGEDLSGTFLSICICVLYSATSRLKRNDSIFTVNLDERRSHYTFAHASSDTYRSVVATGEFTQENSRCPNGPYFL